MDEGIKRLIELGVNATPAIKELDKVGESASKAGDQIGGIEGKLAGFAESITGVFKALAIAELAKEAVEGFLSMVDAADQMTKTAQQVGTTVEKMQELSYALSFAGLKGEESTAMLGRFEDKLSDIGDESNDTSRKLREMGIAAGDDVETALKKMAEAFSMAPDGIDKTALAIEIFGKTVGLQMVPYLNAGADAIDKLTQEKREHGVVSEETAQQSAEFNDNLAKLADAAQELGREIVRELMPSVLAFSKWCVDMIGPITETIKWVDKMASQMTVAAIVARSFGDAIVVAGQDSSKLAGSVDAYGEALIKGTKALPGAQTELDKFGASAEKAAQKFAQLPAEISKLKDRMSYLDPTVAKDALLLKSYEQQLASLEKQLEGTAKKGGGGRKKAVKETKEEFDKWIESLNKSQESLALVDKQVAYLEGALADLNAVGEGSSEWAKKLQVTLDKLRPDALAEALAKVSKAALELDRTPGIIAGMTMRLEEMEDAGEGATTQAKLLREEILKMRAATDPIAAVTVELNKMREAAEKNSAMQNEWFKRLGESSVTAAEFAKGVAPTLGEVHDAATQTISDFEKLGDSIVDASSKFVTDFVGNMIDGFGKTKASFEDMVTDMIKMLAKLIVQWEIANALKSAGFGGATGGKAQGAAWNASGIEYMAAGGILSGPTFFRNQGRLAVAGEAGPEAVVPLQRNASGDLGVASSGVVVNVHNTNGSEIATASKDNTDGSKQIDIYVRNTVKAMMNDGSMDRTMRSTYGVSRQPAAG